MLTALAKTPPILYEILQVPLMKTSAQVRAQDLLDRFSVEAAVQDQCARLSVQGVGDLHRRSLSGTSR